MKHITALIISFCFLLSLTSCNRGVLLDDTRTFSENTWLRFNPERFEVNAPNTDDCYNFTATVVIDTSRYHQAGLPVMLTIESPEHEQRTLFSTILLRNHEGTWLGHFDQDGHLVISQSVRQFYFFNTTGAHTIDFAQRTHYYQIYGIHSLNLLIEKAKLEYPE